jgi:general secretion pathway protein L
LPEFLTVRIDLQQPVTRESLEEALRSFWHWWWGELAPLVPPRWREMLVRAAGRPVVRFADGLCLIVVPGRADEIAIEADLAPQAFRNAIVRTLGHELSEAVLLHLPARSVLRRTVRVPRAALPRLRSAIGLQLERLCPFKADAVAYSCIAERTSDGEAEATVDVAIVTHTTLQEYETWLAGMGLGVARFEVGAHFFAPNARRHLADPRTAALALATLGVVLLLAAYMLAPVLRAAEFEAEARRVTHLRAEAAAALQAKEALDDLAAPLATVAARETAPRPLDVLKAVTIAFPRSVRLETLTIDGRTVRAGGVAADARPLVGILRGAPHIESAALIGPIRHTPNGLDRFVIEISVRS